MRRLRSLACLALIQDKSLSVHAERSIDAATEKPNRAVVGEMLARGMRALTGDADVRDSWARFVVPTDVVGIKVNCSGAPGIMSTPEVVAEIVRNVVAVGVKPDRIWIYERFQEQVNSVHYDRYVPPGVHIWTAVTFARLDRILRPATYVDTTFFDEDDMLST